MGLDPISALAIGGSALGGAVASSNAASAQEKAAQNNLNLQKYIYDQQTSLQEPFRQAGITSQNQLLNYLGLQNTGQPGYGKYAGDFGMADYQQDPGYQFRLSEGLKALNRTAAARGGLLSGATMKAAQDYGQNSASQEYQNAFNRYQTNRSNQLNPLFSLAGSGQNATNAMGQIAQNYGASAGNAYSDIGNAQAAGIMGPMNAITGALGNLTSYTQSNNLLNSLRGSQGYGGQSQNQSFGYVPPSTGYTGPSYLLR